MKKGFILLIFIFLLQTFYANPVEEKIARKVAINFMTYKSQNAKSEIIIKKVENYTYNKDVSFYMYSFEKGGFIIVAADDAIYPVLGYSTTNTLQGSEKNASFQEWIKNYAQEIEKIKQAKNISNTETKKRWDAYLNNDFEAKKDAKAIAPLVKTKWGQGRYYNTQCPEDKNGENGHVLVGCVATTMGQLVNYHNYPPKGLSKHIYYDLNYGWQEVDYGSTTYDWAQIPDNGKLTADHPEATKLLYHCGVAVDMEYGADGSGAYSRVAAMSLAMYLGYDQSVKFNYKSDFTDEQWLAILKTELDAKRPMMYSGHGTGGHAWTCDGYDTEDKIHFNWGWQGSSDGYFEIGDLTPGSSNFNSGNSLVYNIKPPTGSSYPLTFKRRYAPFLKLQVAPDYLSAANKDVVWGICRNIDTKGDNKRVFVRSCDGGATWQAKQINSFGMGEFGMIQAFSDSVAYIPIYSNDSKKEENRVIKTADAGLTWTELIPEGSHSKSFFNIIHFFDENNGVLCGDPDSEFEMQITEDGGQTWTRVDGSKIPDPLNASEYGTIGIFDAVGDNIWMPTTQGRILTSKDKGKTWTSYTLTSEISKSPRIEIAFADDAKTGLAVLTLKISEGNFNFEYYKTTDGGNSWTKFTPTTGVFHSSGVGAVKGTTNTFVSYGPWASKDLRTERGISVTTDGGNNWEELPGCLDANNFVSGTFPAADKYYIGSRLSKVDGGVLIASSKETLLARFNTDKPISLYEDDKYFSTNAMGCINEDLTFTSTSTGNITTYDWNFGEGATPPTANTKGPHTVKYSTVGDKNISLKVGDGTNESTTTITSFVKVANDKPAAIEEIEGLKQVIMGTTKTYKVKPETGTFFVWSTLKGSGLGENYLDSINVSFTNKKYVEMLKVYPKNGCGVKSAKLLKIMVGTKTNINELTSDIKIGPNPATEQFTIISDKNIEQIEIYNTNGTKIKTLNTNKNTSVDVNTSSLQPGIYFVKIQIDGKNITKKLIKN